MKNRIAYRIIIYILILGIIATIAFAPNAGKSDPDKVYWIVGGCLAGLWLVFVIINEIIVHRKLKKNTIKETQQ